MNILVNLPPGFFTHPALTATFARLAALGEVRQRSHTTGEEIRPDLADIEALLMWSWPAWTPELLQAAPHLRFSGQLDITQSGAKAALAHGLPVSVSRGGFSPAVAEMALTLILTTLRRTSDYHAAMRVGSEAWVDHFPTQIDPRERELTGQNVGIVGFGQIGRRLAELLRPFHCELRVVDPYVSEEVLAEHDAQRVSLHEMLQACDVVVLCAASNPGTRYLLGPDEIARLRPEAVLVNVCRAALVDTEALITRLEQGDLFAALDVFDREPLEQDSRLRTLPNAYLTPHRAGGTIAAAKRILEWLVDDLEAFLAGRERRYALTEAMLPSLDAK